MSAHPSIDDHGFLSDTHTMALVGPDGGVDWFCVPAADGPSVFARILDRSRGGTWRIWVEDGMVVDRSYEPETFVLVTRWRGPHGEAEVRDLLSIGGPGEDGEELEAHHVLLRMVHVTSGQVRIGVEVDARPDYARDAARWRADGETWVDETTGLVLRSSTPLSHDGDRLRGTVELGKGEETIWALAYERDAPHCSTLEAADDLLQQTRSAWRTWSSRGTYEGPAPEAVVRSALVLRALSFDETGALLAAPTTSLPEVIGGERNWDYRFTWHRDASLHVLALYLLGHGGLGRRYGEFLIESCVRRTERLRPVAGLRGEQSGEEHNLEHLSGYADSPPVRYGNEAFEQVQHDTFGHVLDAAFTYRRLTGGLDHGHWVALRDVVDTACRDWAEPDHGLWEMRGPKRHYVNSKVLSWACIDRGIRLAEELGDTDAPVDRWRENREAVREDVLERGFDKSRGAFTMAYDSPALDASLLRIPLVGFLPGDDPRVLSTIDRIAEELGDGPALIKRYDTDQVDDGISGGEGAFLLSSFEMVTALVFAGRVDEAHRRFDWLLGHAGPLGLYSEQMDADGTALGNYPQAFTHLGLIEAAVALGRADDREGLQAWAERAEGGLPHR
ncbi:MAG TPA: glycoside hydrolase family 15 protein [Nocardioidaceae bacterium]|nr:glycoside hydrolase family 15 protein [Nocardioidaceae bacterium]